MSVLGPQGPSSFPQLELGNTALGIPSHLKVGSSSPFAPTFIDDSAFPPPKSQLIPPTGFEGSIFADQEDPVLTSGLLQEGLKLSPCQVDPTLFFQALLQAQERKQVALGGLGDESG